ncbi:hypothetical protein [Parafrankia discariae]|uniref:hypothetical protein n=1 Tax=Parafrankia discariae TaxID=365528 RepID=UPI00039CC5EC|nr:hypothetical protein [Parafrankia discariae]
MTIFESAQVGLRDAASQMVQAIVTGLEARTRAAAGDAAGFRATFARGTAILDSARAGDGPPWAYWMAEGAEFPMVLENGRGLMMVGEPHRAVEVLTAQLPGLADYPRDVVLTQAYLAEAHHLAGDQDEAATFADLARSGLAGGVQSPRTAAVLGRLADGLAHRPRGD